MVLRRIAVIAASAALGFGIALHEQPRERVWAATHAAHVMPANAVSVEAGAPRS